MSDAIIDPRFIVRTAVPIFYPKELGQLAGSYGFSIYRGVLVCWDYDYDERVLGWIDGLPIRVARSLLAAGEHKGTLSLLWKEEPPDEYADGEYATGPDGDSWVIGQSLVIGGPPVLLERGVYREIKPPPVPPMTEEETASLRIAGGTSG